MKQKPFAVFLIALFFSVSVLYGQSFLNENTMTIFRGDTDKVQDVNDYAEVNINKAFIMAGGRYDESVNRIRGIKGGFSTDINDLRFGLFYDGYFWGGSTLKVDDNRVDQNEATDGFVLDSSLDLLFGKKSFGGIMFSLDFDNLRFYKNETSNVKVRDGSIGTGAVWGNNFAVGEGTLKPELGFMLNFDMSERKVGSVANGHRPSSMALILTSEYLFAREGQHQTTLSFGDVPLIVFGYRNDGPPSVHVGGGVYNTAFFELKQVYDLSGSLSLGYLAGLNLAINSPPTTDDYFEFGFLPRLSAALTYKANEKFLFNTGVRLGALRPDMVSFTTNPDSLNDNFGIYYWSDKTGTKTASWNFLSFVGAWGIGLLWQPEKIFSADFSVDTKLNTDGQTGIDVNVLFALNL